jgi:hypothetical protein
MKNTVILVWTDMFKSSWLKLLNNFISKVAKQEKNIWTIFLQKKVSDSAKTTTQSFLLPVSNF